MKDQSNALATAGDGTSSIQQTSEDRRLAREAHHELQILGMNRTNLLLVGTAGAIRIVLGMLWLDLHEPILRWQPGQQLELPPAGRAATLVLHDVNELTDDDQHNVLRWLDETAGRIRVVSTSVVPLWPRVESGAFNDVLYYRLNTVCLGVAA